MVDGNKDGNNSNSKSYNSEYINLCVEAYERAAIALKYFENSKEALIAKSFIITKNIKRNVNGNTVTVPKNFLEIIDQKNGRKIKKRKLLRDSELAYYKEQLQHKEASRILMKELTNRVTFWKNILNPLIKKGIINFSNISESISQKFSLLNDIEKHNAEARSGTVNQNIYNDKIITLNNENVRSKNECIFANLLHFHKIPYYYEKKLNIKTFNKYYQYNFIKPDFTIFVNNKIIYIEILGIADNKDYSDHWKVRESIYAINGIERGKNLACFSCSGNNIDTALLNDWIVKIKSGDIPAEIVNID